MKPVALIAVCAAVALAGCEAPRDESVRDTPPERAAPAMPPAPASTQEPHFIPSGPTQPLEAATDQPLQWAASVVAIDELPAQPGATVKLFGVAGGDPAMNGLQTFIAFYIDPAEGWRVFQVGDFLSYRVVGEAPGRVDLEIDESMMDAETGEIGERSRRLILSWTAPEGEAPDAVAAAEAR